MTRFCTGTSKEETETIHNDDYCAAFVAHNSDGQGDAAQERKGDEHNYGSERDNQVLANDASRPLAELKSGKKILEAIMHKHDIGLFKSSIGPSGTHGNADVGRSQAGRIINAIPNHGHSVPLLRK